jgi:predicted metallopeptidase
MERYKNPDHLKSIILHELSHIPEWELGKNPTHGRLFKEAANKMGVPKTYVQKRWDSSG